VLKESSSVRASIPADFPENDAVRSPADERTLEGRLESYLALNVSVWHSVRQNVRLLDLKVSEVFLDDNEADPVRE